MRYRVVIYAFTLRRDVAVSIILADILSRYGCDVVVACCRNFTRLIKYWRPHAVIVNVVSRIAQVKKIFPEAMVFLWPGEGWVSKEYSDALVFKNDYPQCFTDVEKILLWGKLAENFFQECFPDSDGSKWTICGNPKLDLIKFNKMLQNKNIKRPSKRIGFLCRFPSINQFDAKPVIYSLLDPSSLYTVSVQCSTFVFMLKVCDYIISNTEYNLSFRPHPLESPEMYCYLQKKYPGRIHIDDSIDLAYWASQHDVLIATSSSSFLETYLLNVPVINIDHLAMDVEKWGNNQPLATISLDNSMVPKSWDELKDILKNKKFILTNNPNIKLHLEEGNHWFNNSSAILNAAQEILKPLSQSAHKQRNILPKLVLSYIDSISYKRAYKRSVLHANFNYYAKVHHTPKYFAKIVEEIMQFGKLNYEMTS